MLGIIGSFIGGMFSNKAVQDLAIDGMRKLGGLDEMTDKEKAAYLLKLMETTKHQSPMRRLIAFLLTSLFALFSIVWLIAAGFGYYFDFQESLNFAGAIRNYFEAVIREPFTWIVSFYFVIDLATKFKSK